MSAARAGSAFLALAAALVLMPSEGAANKVGVAAAVNPDAFSGGKQIRIGKSIFYNERISTDANGVVQVLLMDGSTFTVGKNSDVVIDKFVYNPNKKTGEIVTSFSKGSMRFIGGKISKNPGGVTVNTPDGSLAIRGGMFQGVIGPETLFSFLYGREMVFTGRNGKVYTVYQPGYTLALGGGTPLIRPTSPADIQTIMAGLTNSNTNTAGVNTETQQPQPNYVITPMDFQQLIVDATGTRIADEILRQLLALRDLPELPIDETIEFSIGGYGAGLVGPDGDGEYGIGASTSPSDFSFDAQTQAITLTLRDVGGDGDIDRGVFTFNPVSANKWTLSQFQLFNQSGTPVQVVSAEGEATRQTQPLCSSCAFMEWGSFNAAYSYNASPSANYPTSETIDMGLWVGGQVTAVKDLPVTGTASFAGSAFGTIANSSQLQGVVMGRGDLGMTWDFARRSGQFSISNFNADPVHELPTLNAGGTMTMPGNLNRFSGTIAGAAGQTPVSGGAFGSFVTDGRRPAAGVIGNWGVQGANGYRATGIFGGAARR